MLVRQIEVWLRFHDADSGSISTDFNMFAQVMLPREEATPIWKALEAAYSDCAGAFDSETWMEARFYHDLRFNPLPESFQEIQNHLQKQRTQFQMPSFAGDDPGRYLVSSNGGVDSL